MSLDTLCRLQVEVSVYCAMRIPAHLRCTVLHPVAPYRYLLHTVYLFMADIANPDLFVCVVVGPGFLSTTASSGSAWSACQKTVNRAPLLGTGGFDTICTSACNRPDIPTPCMMCRLEPRVRCSASTLLIC